MEFNPNKTRVEIIKEGAFAVTYFRDIYPGVNRKWYKNSWKESDELKKIHQKFYCSEYYDVDLNKYKVKTGTSLRFWQNKGQINEIDLYVQSVDTFQEEDLQMMKDNRWEKIVDLKVYQRK